MQFGEEGETVHYSFQPILYFFFRKRNKWVFGSTIIKKFSGRDRKLCCEPDSLPSVTTRSKVSGCWE